MPTPPARGQETGDAAFDTWMAAVDAAFTARFLVSVHDMPDAPFADWYEDGLTPGEAAHLTMENGI